MVNIGTLKHCENFLKFSNEIKQYVKYTIIKSHAWPWASFPNGNCNKMIKIKNDVIITTYRQISKHPIGLVIGTVANQCFATIPINITPIWCYTKIAFTINKEYSKSTIKAPGNCAETCLKLTKTWKQYDRYCCGTSVVKSGQVPHPM